jgi:hypothetical protein
MRKPWHPVKATNTPPSQTFLNPNICSFYLYLFLFSLLCILTFLFTSL